MLHRDVKPENVLRCHSKVRRTPSCPKIWADCSRLQPYSHRNAWAISHILGRPNASLAPGQGHGAGRGGGAAVLQARGLRGASPGPVPSPPLKGPQAPPCIAEDPKELNHCQLSNVERTSIPTAQQCRARCCQLSSGRAQVAATFDPRADPTGSVRSTSGAPSHGRALSLST